MWRRKSNEMTLGEAIDFAIKEMRIDRKINSERIALRWESLMGRAVAQYTKEIFIKGDKLFLRFDSAAMRQEMFYSRERIAELVNEDLGQEVIKTVIVL